MASTLIRRICNVNLLTDEEKTAIMQELELADEDGLDLGILTVCYVAQEILAGRKEAASSMAPRLTSAELVDASAIITGLATNTLAVDLTELERCLKGIETGEDDPEYLEELLGLT